LLYAGTTSFNCFKYSIKYNNTVKILKQRSKSAGNIVNGTSETIRDEIVVSSQSSDQGENVNHIINHIAKHSKPYNDQELGHYLAGLIDGDGHFNNIPQLVIVFSASDAFLAYFLKTCLGFGHVRKIKNKNAYLLIISNKDGILKIVNLINGKLRTENKFNQVINNILINDKYSDYNINFTMNLGNNYNNH
jgi:hypothetical protein